MKRPAFQFYPKDWRGNLKLARCSDAAKGAWIQILCVLHDSEEYGVARFPLKELVSAAGVKLASARELVDKGVLKGGDADVEAFIYIPRHAGKAGAPVTLLEASAGPLWYSSRFVKDEYRRQTAGVETRFKPTNPPGGSPPGPPPTQRAGTRQGDGSAVAVASAVLNHDVSTTASSNTSAAPQPVDNTSGHGPGKSKPKARGNGHAWWKTDDGIVAEGKRLGIVAKPGEAMDAFKQRLFEASRATA